MRMVVMRYCVAALCSVLLFSGAAIGNQPSFTESELLKFLDDGPEILQWFHENGQTEPLHQICRYPRVVDTYPDICHVISAHDWQPQRFAYILSRLVVGYKASKIGSDSNHVVCKLNDLKQKITRSPKLASDEKERLHFQIDNCLNDVRHTMEASKDISNTEKTLMYIYRERLHNTFRNKLPIRPVSLPNLE